MVRKIVLVVPVFALAFLLVSRIAARIEDDGLACAQDAAVADDGDQNTSGAIKFSGSGTLDGTVTTPCSHVECFSLSGMVTKTSVKGLGTGDISGSGFLDSCTTNDHTKKECCTLTATETYSFSDGDLDVMLSGMVCGKNPKKVTAHIPYEIMGGTSTFSGASGSGKAKFTFDEDTLMATFSFKGELTE